jgi:hypothetical protein
MMLSSIDSQALKVDITKKVEEMAMAGEKGCTTERKAAASSGDGPLKEEKLQVEVEPLVRSEELQTPCSDFDVTQPEELETLNPNSSTPDESNTQTPNSHVSEESDTNDSEPEDLEEYLTKKWAEMMAELGYEESDFASYRELYGDAADQEVEKAA